VGTNWAAFVGVVLVAYLVPGPDFAVILRSATRGPRAGAAAAAGAQVGLCVHMLLAVVGLSVVLASHPNLLTVIRVVGGSYLAYLGGRLVIPTFRRPAAGRVAAATVSAHSAFTQALFTNVLNPKAVLFFAAVLPQFIAPGSVPVRVQVATLGAVDIALGFLAWTVVIALGVRLSAALKRDTVRRWWDRTTGTVLAGLGVGLLLTHE